MENTKTCTMCGYEQPIDEFYLLGNGLLYSWCKTCANETASESGMKRRLDRKTKGVCVTCGSPKMTGKEHCQVHYVATLLRYALGSSATSLAHRMLEKLQEQNFTCPYTGEKLVLGENTSIDHIYPKSRFPDKAKDIENLEWVSRVANSAKGDMTKEEFLSTYSLRYIGG